VASPAFDPVAVRPGDGVGPAGLAVPSSEPYPWPYDGAAAARHTALVVVAAQEGLVPRCADADAAVAVIGQMTAAARGWGATIIATRHAASPAQHRPGVLPGAGTKAWELLGTVDDADTVIDAFGVDGFAGSPLAEYLAGRDIDHLLICGLGLEGPVHSTLRSANDRGLECLLVIDGCACLDATMAAAGVRMIEMSGGIFGAVAPSSAVITRLAAASTT
jgi:nicotinamidase-related amidase